MNFASAQTQLAPLRLPVVFIPGIAGSKLIGGGETGKNGNGEYLWPTIDPDEIAALEIGSGGAADVQAVDVLDSYAILPPLPPLPFYKPFITRFTDSLQADGFGYRPFALKESRQRIITDLMLKENPPWLSTGCKPDFFVFPYDWRLSSSSHISDLNTYIRNIRELHRGEKVNIVAHSMGGLLMRRYILQHPEDIHCAVTIASPILGAPKAAYRMLTGEFYDLLPVDLITNPSMKRALCSLPAVYELLPSDVYMSQRTTPGIDNGFATGGGFVFAELRWDPNRNQYLRDDFDTPRFKSFLNGRVLELMGPRPIKNLPYGGNGVSGVNEAFHNYSSQQQDDWSADSTGIHYLHIAGRQSEPETTLKVVRRVLPLPTTPAPGTTASYLHSQLSVEVFEEETGWGDGTVPEFSALRIPSLRARRAQTKRYQGNNVEHLEITENVDALEYINAFLNDNAPERMTTIPPGCGPIPGGGSDTRSLSVDIQRREEKISLNLGVPDSSARYHILILGQGFVDLVDGDGNVNTRVTNIASKTLPGLSVQYGGDQPFVSIRGELKAGLKLSGVGTTETIDILIQRMSATTSAVDWMERYRFNPEARNWTLSLPANGNVNQTLAAIDWNGNTAFEPDEVIDAYSTQSGDNVDIHRPRLRSLVTKVGKQTRVRLIADDPGNALPKIYYAIDQGPVQTYTGDIGLLFATGDTHVIHAYAEDENGNTSELVTTTLPSQPFSMQSGLRPTNSRMDLQLVPEEGFAYQWHKNGVPIPGANGPNYAISSPALSAMAIYSVRGTRTGSAATTERCVIGMVDVAPQFLTVNEGSDLTLNASARAPIALSYQWRKDGIELTDGNGEGREVKGSRSARLVIKPYRPQDQGQYCCVISMTNPDGTAAPLQLSTGAYVASIRLKPVLDVTPPPPSVVSGVFIWQLSARHNPVAYSVTGLPSGIVFNARTGLVSGVPNISGDFVVRVSARNAVGTSGAQEFTLRVAPLSTEVVGQHTGLISRHQDINGMLGGRFSLNVTPTGAYSGLVMNGGLKHRIRGRLEVSLNSRQEVLSLARSALLLGKNRPFEILFAFDSPNRFVGGGVTGVFDNLSRGNSLSGRKVISQGARASMNSGIYNSVSATSSWVNQPQGSGFQHMHVGPSGLVRVTGYTPDGIAYTFAGTVWEDGSLPEFVLLYGGKGSLTGMPQITSPEVAQMTRIEGWLEQYKSGPSSPTDRLYRSGIQLLRRTVSGGRYFPPNHASPIILGKTDGPDNASISFVRGGIETAAQSEKTSQRFQITSANRAVFSTSQTTNPCNVKMTINSKTGFFSGSMTLTDPMAGRSVTRAVRYFGLVVSSQQTGYGLFILPGLSPTVATAPILTGSVTLN